MEYYSGRGHRGGRGGRGRGGAGGDRGGGKEVAISKTLSWILRHGALELGLNMRKDGYVPVSELLLVQSMKKLHVTVDDIKGIVDTNDKKRYQLTTEQDIDGNDLLLIRAVQGHTITQIADDELLEPVKDPFQIDEVVHGTYLNCIEPIMKTGLSKMARNHIHMAIGMPSKKGVVSGMRKSCEVVVEVNIVKAMNHGVPFFISQNKVILTSGKDGSLAPDYFRSVIDVKNQKYLYSAPFDYIVVYDFECQCEEGTKNLTFNEIIEFPVLVIDVKNKKVVGEFQTYVKPTIHPELTEFCTKLTGIEQKQVDSGVTLEEALRLIHKFLEDLGIFKSEFVFLSCGDFDGNQIRREALFKKINIPSYLKRWINIKKVFPVHLFDKTAQVNEVKFIKDVRKPPVKGMPHMLELCQLQLEGKHHSGIDDSRNIAACAIKCLQEGFVFTQGMVLSHPFNIDDEGHHEPQEEEKY